MSSGTTELDSEQRKALQAKIGEAGFRAIGRIGIAGTNEASLKTSRMLTALRQAEAPGVQIDLIRAKPGRIASASPDRKWPLVINIRELAALGSAWPLGDLAYPGLNRSGSRLPPRYSAVIEERPNRDDEHVPGGRTSAHPQPEGRTAAPSRARTNWCWQVDSDAQLDPPGHRR